MGEHDFDGGLRHALMAVKIQLEAFAQNLFVDLADAALPRRAGIGDDDVNAAELRRHAVERGMHGRGVGHVAFYWQRRRTDGFGLRGGGGKVHVKQRYFGSRRGKGPGGGGTDRSRGAGDGGDLSCERRILADAKLGLFQWPIFAVEHFGFGDQLKSTDVFRGADDGHPFWRCRRR